MSRGILMFAHDNGLFNYGKMAYASALAARYYLHQDISLVTDTDTWNSLLMQHPEAEDFWDQTIFIEPKTENKRHYDMADGGMQKAAYHNTTRMRAYALTPYDETILLDTDVLVQDPLLNGVWGSQAHIRMNHGISEMIRMYGHTSMRHPLEAHTVDLFWATIMYFKKSRTVEQFFETMQLVVANYQYYGVLYGFPSNMLRVDFVVTIAAHLMSGYVHDARPLVDPLPFEETLFAWNKDVMLNVTKGKALFASKHDAGTFPVIANRTVHVMNKDSMLANADKIIQCYG